MNQEHDKHEDLLRQMADKLREHNEPYREGAWEQFAAKAGWRRPRRVVAGAYWSAAAILVATAVVVLLLNRTSEPEYVVDLDVPSDTVERTLENAEGKEYKFTDTANHLVDDTGLIRLGASNSQTDRADLLTVPSGPVELETERYSSNVPPSMPKQVLAVGVSVLEAEVEAILVAQDTAKAAFIDESLVGKGIAREDLSPPSVAEVQTWYADIETPIERESAMHDNRWDLALVLAPSVTSERFNMSGGLAVSYRVSDKISISSGVSLSEMGVGQHPVGSTRRELASALDSPVSDLNGSSELNAGYNALGGTYLASATSRLLAMDIPFDIRYHLTERFYSSIGVSMLAILDEQRTMHYTTTTVSNTLSGTQQHRHDFSQKAAYQPIADQRFGGFVNFSVGHRVPLSTRVSLSFEPYFKLPMGSLSQQDMNMTQGGLKIVTGF